MFPHLRANRPPHFDKKLTKLKCSILKITHFLSFLQVDPLILNKKHTRLNCNLLKLQIFFKSSPSLCNQEIKQDSFFDSENRQLSASRHPIFLSDDEGRARSPETILTIQPICLQNR